MSMQGTWDKSKLSPRGFPQATVVLCRWQRAGLIVLAALLAWGACVSWRTEIFWLNGILTAFYLLATLYRILIIQLALKKPQEIVISDDRTEVGPGKNGEWPRYLVLLPMYREAGILPHLLENMRRLDYPADRLEIRLLIEADDDETRQAADSMNLEPPFKIKLIPPSQPRTKPKACNVGLEDADADLLVIYDAEDRPDPRQLKTAAWAFAQCDDKVACVQAKLGYYNGSQNILAKCFAAEYATWFGLCLPGLDRLQAPIPLGGTSNHFRFEVLKAVGGWDEFNVTEDCDLGLRLFAQGYRTRIIKSSTLEQACCNVPGWIRQRSRWVKGYVQTYLVHTRDFFGLHRRLGLWNALQFHLLIGGSVLSQLLNPLYWMTTLAWLVLHPQRLGDLYPLPIFLMSIFCLLFGNFTFIYTSAIACVRRGIGHLAPVCLIMPAYWAMMSLAAWKGFFQLFFKPNYWEKTMHSGELIEMPTVKSAAENAPDAKKNTETKVALTPAGNTVETASAHQTGTVSLETNPPAEPAEQGQEKQQSFIKRAMRFCLGTGIKLIFFIYTAILFISIGKTSGLNNPAEIMGSTAERVSLFLLLGHGWGRQMLAGCWRSAPAAVVFGSGLGFLAMLVFAFLGLRLLKSWLKNRWYLGEWLLWMMLFGLGCGSGCPTRVPLMLLFIVISRKMEAARGTNALNSLTALSCAIGCLGLCGIGGMVMGLVFLAVNSISMCSGDADRKRQIGVMTMLWLPYLAVLAVLLLWNWLVLGDCLFLFRDFACDFMFAVKKGGTACGSFMTILGVSLVLLAFALYPTAVKLEDKNGLKEPRWEIALSLAVLLALMVGKGVLWYAPEYTTALLLLAGCLLFFIGLLFWRMREAVLDIKKAASAVLMLLVAFVGVAGEGFTAGAYQNTPETSEETRVMMQDLENFQHRIMLYGTKTPLYFCDFREKKVCPRVLFDEAELMEMSQKEQLFILLPSPDSADGCTMAPILKNLYELKAPYVMMEKVYGSWRLLRVIPNGNVSR